jgi:hypothetical protein
VNRGEVPLLIRSAFGERLNVVHLISRRLVLAADVAGVEVTGEDALGSSLLLPTANG